MQADATDQAHQTAQQGIDKARLISALTEPCPSVTASASSKVSG